MVLAINTLDLLPIYEQLRDQIILGIASKQLKPNEPLPSVRRMAADLGINFHTVNKAYTALCDDGYIKMDRRKGALVANTMPPTEGFKVQLARKMLIIAAEAICHRMSKEEFTAFCENIYTKAQGVKKEENL